MALQFNRIEVEVLSVVATQIASVMTVSWQPPWVAATFEKNALLAT